MARDLFKAETLRKYSDMRSRFAAKYKDKEKTQLKKAGRKLPFTLEEFRGWIQVMQQQPSGLRCSYCGRALKLKDMEVDHDVPDTRGGGLGLYNLTPSCNKDNVQKGELTGEEYLAFLSGLATFPEEARKYILKKMRQRPLFRSHDNVTGKKAEAQP